MTGENRCSDGSAAAGEDLAGSAPVASAWVALEQNGPWGARAWTQSHLPVDLGRLLEERAAAHGVRPALIRRPGRHADQRDPALPRRLLVAHTAPGSSWLLEATLVDPGQLLDLDWAAAAAGDIDAVRRTLSDAEISQRSHLLVCTNGTRDLCCAATGRPLALAVARQQPGRVWEVTHTSGHRFAPTAVLLPAGTLHGRLDATAAHTVMSAAERGETVLAGHRGRSSLSAAAQVADLFVRRLVGETRLDVVDAVAEDTDDEHRWRCAVTHHDGRRWSVEVVSEPTEVERAESCGKGLATMRRWRTRLVDETGVG